MTMAMTKLMTPVKPSSMDSVAPRSPDTMPSGRPKFSPQPEWIIGTMANTSIAFQLKRLIVLVSCVVKFAPTNGAVIKSSSRNPAMISLGNPNLSMNSAILLFFVRSNASVDVLPMLSPSYFT
jgi:hypothetical protein